MRVMRVWIVVAIAAIALALVYLMMLPADATAAHLAFPAAQEEMTGCLRLYDFVVFTNANNNYYWISVTLDNAAINPTARLTDAANHLISVALWTGNDWGIKEDLYIWLPSTQPFSPLFGDPVLPFTVAIQYQLQSTCAERGCGRAAFKVRLQQSLFNYIVILSDVAENGNTRSGVITYIFTDTTNIGILIQAEAFGTRSDPSGGSGLATFVVRSINNTQCYVPPPTGYFRPVVGGVLGHDSDRMASWIIVTATTPTLIYAPTDGIVEGVEPGVVVISSPTPLGRYQVAPVLAPADLAGRHIEAGCALGFWEPGEQQQVNPRVVAEIPISPSVGSYLVRVPSGGPCMEAWQCYNQIIKGEPLRDVTITLPARIFPLPAYFLDFTSAFTAGALSFMISNPRYPGDTYFNLRVAQQPSNQPVWEGILQILYAEKANYVVSPTTFAEGENRLWLTVDPQGAANLHQICVLSLGGGELIGVCPPPREDGWNLGENATWEGSKARLREGGWIWKEATIFLPPSPSSAGPQGADGGVGVGDVEPSAIAGRYEARVRMESLSGSPVIYFEKELAPGIWKTLETISVTERAYYNLVTQFETGQQFLTIRLRASGGEVLVSEVCSEEEEREAELIEPCFGIKPYNPPPLDCNLLECPVAHVRYQMQKLHDIAILPPLCKIAYWVNYLYYYALNTIGKPILMYLTTIAELIREYGPIRGIVEALKVLLESLWISLIKPYGTLLVNWLWRTFQPVIDFLGISEYTLKLLQQFFSLLFTLFRKAFVILANGTVGLIRAAWLGFRQGLTATPTTPPVPPESIQLGMELIGYAYGNLLIIPLVVVFTGLIMWQFFFWSLKVMGVVK